VPLFGGSAGDGTRFGQTFVLQTGFSANAAVLTLVRTACRVRVFSLNHLSPPNRRMVVTEADPRGGSCARSTPNRRPANMRGFWARTRGS
jgi:hypothetical protein